MKFCECNRTHFDPMHRGSGSLLICSHCNGYIACEFCTPESSDTPFPNIASYVIAGSYACWHHAWIGIAKTVSAEELN